MTRETRAVLIHLVNRVRAARKDLSRVRKNYPDYLYLMSHREGAENEAWNCLQSAKEIAFRQ